MIFFKKRYTEDIENSQKYVVAEVIQRFCMLGGLPFDQVMQVLPLSMQEKDAKATLFQIAVALNPDVKDGIQACDKRTLEVLEGIMND